MCVGPMAQLVRAPPCHGGGRGFESHSGRCCALSVQAHNALQICYMRLYRMAAAPAVCRFSESSSRVRSQMPVSSFDKH